MLYNSSTCLDHMHKMPVTSHPTHINLFHTGAIKKAPTFVSHFFHSKDGAFSVSMQLSQFIS